MCKKYNLINNYLKKTKIEESSLHFDTITKKNETNHIRYFHTNTKASSKYKYRDTECVSMDSLV